MISYVVEIAGKDSIAAAHKFICNNKVDLIIPTIVYTGTEYGDYTTYSKSIKYVMDTCQKNDVNITEPIILKNERLWNLICIRYQHLLNKKYGFYTPCIMCHMFTHLLRIPVFLNNKCSGIITGERFSHDGNIKANQHQLTINCFKNLFDKYNISLIAPFLKIADTNIINNEISDYKFISEMNDLKCILAGNLNDFNFLCDESLINLKNYLNEYVLPVAEYILNCFYTNNILQYDVLENLIKRRLM